MKRGLLLAPLLASLLSSTVLAAGNYFPNAPSTIWRYSSGETQVIGQPVTVNGVSVIPTAHQIGGTTVSEDLLEYRGGGVYLRGVRIGKQVIWYTPPLTVYPSSPLSLGQRWESSSGGLKLSSRVMGNEPLSLPAGNFNALLIRSDVSSGKSTSTQYSYFVPGLGVVRYQAAGGQVVDLVK
ncbi:hypothetical protein EHF33_00105 [Deinococcus psychrotolerans]|uniref:Uncharacterized protein n=1 Tax=Deinococcus psychrotolerans TaxID=2489213 RepID=A0A3G8YJX9_9DEIO|nr:hypothetical protein [Deinococcus psychrotolerans]AZI41346.1 hypothetical protein EHF33_00105 [Deinococcus psychrotolerans]